MMKMRKRIGALLLSLGMMASLLTAVPASAAEELKTGSITVHKFEVRTQEDYNAMKENLENTNSSGLELNIEQNETLKDLRPMENIGFTLTQVVDEDVEIADPMDAQQVEGTTPQTIYTNAQGLAEFTNLPLGLYRLEELDDGRVKTPMDPVLISVPTYNQEHKDDPSADEFNYHIHVYPKNLIHPDGPDIEKDVVQEGNNDASVNIGDPFDWIILGDVPKISADLEEEKLAEMYYRILDTLDSKLDFVGTKSVVLRSADEERKLELKEGDDYTFTRKPDKNGRELIWELTPKAIQDMSNYTGGKVVVTFTTKLNDEAKNALGEAIENQATLEYENEDGNEYNTPSDKPEVHTGGVKIKKVDKADGTTPLQGAEFKIYKSKADAEADKNAIKIGSSYIVTSDSDGIADFYGLAYGTTEGMISGKPIEGSTTYWVVETKAPEVDGIKYNRLKDPFEVTVNATSHEEGPKGYKTVYNAKDNYELPFTGGTGIVIFLGAGAVLLIAGYVISRNGKNKAAK